MTKLYNLIDQQWIPIQSINHGKTGLFSLKEVLHKSHKLTAIQGSTPLETASLYRLLIAVVHTIYKFNGKQAYTELWKCEQIDNELIESYLRRHDERFYLFHPEFPFFQNGQMAERNAESISSLMAHLASGDDATLFEHTTRAKDLALKPDQAARALVAIQAFGLCGTKDKGLPFADAPCARGITFFIEGNTLFETLKLNMIDDDLREYRLKRHEDDQPVWEMDEPYKDDPRRPYGILDHLTWPNRSIKLIPLGDSVDNVIVKQMLYAAGLKTLDTKSKSVRDVFNPFHHWQANTNKQANEESRSHFSVIFREGRALWRDSSILLQVSKGENDGRDKSPWVIRNLQDLANSGKVEWGDTYRLLAFGACTKPGQDKTFFYRAEKLPLPLAYLKQAAEDLLSRITDSVRNTQQIADDLRRACFLLAWLHLYPNTETNKFVNDKGFFDQSKIESKIAKGRNEKSDDKEAQSSYKLYLSWNSDRTYWSRLEPHFHTLLLDLPKEVETAMQTWRNHLRRSAQAAFAYAESCAGSDLRSQRACAKARDFFELHLNMALKVTDPNKSTEETRDE